MELRGVLNSWDASAVKRLSVSKEFCRRCSRSLRTRPYDPTRRRGFRREAVGKSAGGDGFRSQRHLVQRLQRFESHAISGETGKQKCRRHGQQQERNELQDATLDRSGTVGEPDQQGLVPIEWIWLIRSGFLRQANAALVVTEGTFAGKGRLLVLPLQLGIAKKHLPDGVSTSI